MAGASRRGRASTGSGLQARALHKRNNSLTGGRGGIGYGPGIQRNRGLLRRRVQGPVAGAGPGRRAGNAAGRLFGRVAGRGGLARRLAACAQQNAGKGHKPGGY